MRARNASGRWLLPNLLGMVATTALCLGPAIVQTQAWTHGSPERLTSGVCPAVAITPYFTIAYGTVQLDGASAPVGTVVEAVSPRGDVVGCFEVSSAGHYGAVSIYGADGSADPPIPGMEAGEVVAFRVSGATATASPNLVWQDDWKTAPPHKVDLMAWQPDLLEAPSNLVATGVSQAQANLNWQDNSSDESAFHIERSPSGSTGWIEMAIVGANAKTFSDTGLNCGTTYYYRVRAHRVADGQYSAYSNVDSATTGACPLEAPSNLTATVVSPTEIDLSWRDNSPDESAFHIERSADGISDWAQIATTGTNTTTLSDTGLDCGTAYHYRVRAYRAADAQYSAYSNVDGATTGTCPLEAPSALAATAVSPTEIGLSWQDNSPDESAFHLERSPDGVTGWAEVAIVGASAATFSDAGLDCGTAYHYRIRAHRAADGQYSAYSNVDSATTGACPVNAPSNLSATATSQSQIDLSWQDNAGDESAFHLERSPDGTAWTEIDSVSANVTAYADTGLLCDTTYHYRLRAFRSSDALFSTYSNVAQATTDACTTVNVVDNPGFEEGKSPWSFYTSGTGSFATTSPAYQGNASARLTFNTTGTNMQLYQSDIPLLPNTLYRLSFAAFSSTGHDVCVYLAKHSAPYTAYGLSNHCFDLSSSWQQHAVEFTTTGFSTPVSDGRLRFWFVGKAQNGDVYWFDDVLLAEVPSGPPPEEYTLTTSTVGSGNVAQQPNLATYPEGSDVILTAQPDPGWRFDAWSGDLATTDNPTTLSMLRDMNVTATFLQEEYTLTVNVAGSGQVQHTPGNPYLYGEVATLEPIPANDWSFAGWTGPNAAELADNGDGTWSLTMDGDKSVTATFSNSPPLNAPSNLSATATSQTQIDLLWQDNAGDETAFHLERSPDGIAWTEIDTVSANVTTYADTGLLCDTTYHYRLRAFRGSDALFSTYSNVAQATTDACTTVNVVDNPGFEEGKSPWSFYTSGTGSFATTSPAYQGVASARLTFSTTGTNMQLYQSNIALLPNTLYRLSFAAFSSTGHDVCVYLAKHASPYTPYGLNNYCFNLSTSWQQHTVEFTTTGFSSPISDGRLRFWFVSKAQNGDVYWFDDVVLAEVPSGPPPEEYTLTTSTVGSGAVSRQPDLPAYPEGTDVTLTAQPDPGWRFDAWSGDLATTDNPTTASMDHDMAVTATFVQEEYTLTVDVAGSGQVQHTPGNPYLYGQAATLEPIPVDDWSFAGWTGPNAAELTDNGDGTWSLTMDGDKSVTATFSNSPPLNAPSNLSATAASQTQIDLLWQDNADDESAFHLERSPDGTAWTEIDTVSANVTTYADTGLLCDTTYHYRLRAFRSSDALFSTYSNVAQATTDACTTINVVDNPGFEEGKSPWSFYTSGSGSFATTSPAYQGVASARLTFTTTGTNMQLYQSNIALLPNTLYRLSFAAFSSTGHDVCVYLAKHASPYTPYGLNNYCFDLSTSWQQHAVEFTTTGFSSPVSDGRLRFWFVNKAQNGDVYWFDEVVLEEVNE